MPQRLVLSLFVFLTCITQVATAQPPGLTRWTENTATTQAQGLDQGDPLVLTWSIAREQTELSNSTSSNLVAFLDGIYSNGFDEYQPLLQSAIGRWGEVSGLTIVFEPEDDGTRFSSRNFAAGSLGVRGDIRFGGRFIDGTGGVLAFANFSNLGGDVTIDTGDGTFSNLSGNSLRLRNVIAHEFGHTLGFFAVAGHVVSSDTRQLLEPTLETTVDGPQYHDILSVQRGYGDIYETGAGNDTANNATELGMLLDGDSVVLGESAHRRGTSLLFDAQPTGIEIRPDEVDFISIDDQTDIDVFSFTIVESGSVGISLDTLGESYMAGGENQNNQILFDTSERVDLALELLATDGQTVLETSDAGGFGDDEILSDISLEPGTYFVRITGVNNSDDTTLDTQFYGLEVSFETEGVVIGDINLSGVIDFLDIAPFILRLSAGEFQAEADINQDGMVDFLDIGPFISLLQGS